MQLDIFRSAPKGSASLAQQQLLAEATVAVAFQRRQPMLLLQAAGAFTKLEQQAATAQVGAGEKCAHSWPSHPSSKGTGTSHPVCCTAAAMPVCVCDLAGPLQEVQALTLPNAYPGHALPTPARPVQEAGVDMCVERACIALLLGNTCKALQELGLAAQGQREAASNPTQQAAQQYVLVSACSAHTVCHARARQPLCPAPSIVPCMCLGLNTLAGCWSTMPTPIVWSRTHPLGC